VRILPEQNLPDKWNDFEPGFPSLLKEKMVG